MHFYIPSIKINKGTICKRQLWASCQSISKNDEKGELPNEDAFKNTGKPIGIADGAGGVGLYAGEWADYLLTNLPEKPLSSAKELNEFLRNHWRIFFETYKSSAESKGIGKKFITEGSLATLVAAWMDDNRPGFLKWIAVGDSALLSYNMFTNRLSPLNIQLDTFLKPPFLVNLLSPLGEAEFKSGSFSLHPDEILLFATDALAQYIMLGYALCNKGLSNEFEQNMQNIMASPNRLITLIENMIHNGYPNLNFHHDVILPLLSSMSSTLHFRNYTNNLLAMGLIDIDDYTLLTLHY